MSKGSSLFKIELPRHYHKAPYREALRLAWPASVAASVTPLLGAIDVWALGQSARPLEIAAVGLGSIIFSMVYWTFGFIRMSVAGLTAQAIGANDEAEARAALARGSIIGITIGLILVIFMIPLGNLAVTLLSLESAASDTTMDAARTYFDIRILGAPLALGTYAALGWLTARGRTDFLMIISVGMTILNIILDYWFVVGLNRGADGVALGTLIAECSGFIGGVICVAYILKKNGGLKIHWNISALIEPTKLKRTLSVNRDIFIRTALLAFSFAWFTQRGGSFGDVTLAANQVLLQMFLFTGLALDGTAIAAETLIGRAMGNTDKHKGRALFDAAILATSIPALIAALAFVILYASAGKDIIALLTPPGDIRNAAITYLPWVTLSPLMVLIAFQLDGIFIGATRSREMRDGMIISTAIFIPASLLLAAQLQNHGLWLAFSFYFLLRGATLGYYMRDYKNW